MPVSSLFEAIRRCPLVVLERDEPFWTRAVQLNMDTSLGATVPDVYVIFAEHPCYCEDLSSEDTPCASCLSKSRLSLKGYLPYPD